MSLGPLRFETGAVPGPAGSPEAIVARVSQEVGALFGQLDLRRSSAEDPELLAAIEAAVGP